MPGGPTVSWDSCERILSLTTCGERAWSVETMSWLNFRGSSLRSKKRHIRERVRSGDRVPRGLHLGILTAPNADEKSLVSAFHDPGVRLARAGDAR